MLLTKKAKKGSIEFKEGFTHCTELTCGIKKTEEFIRKLKGKLWRLWNHPVPIRLLCSTLMDLYANSFTCEGWTLKMVSHYESYKKHKSIKGTLSKADVIIWNVLKNKETFNRTQKKQLKTTGRPYEQKLEEMPPDVNTFTAGKISKSD